MTERDGAAAQHPGDGRGRQPVALWPAGETRFLVTVDTEEEFDWTGPFSADNRATTHVPAIARFQAMCEAAGIAPVYLVDHPIVADDTAVAMMTPWFASGRASVGAQLHPWVNPPFDEGVGVRNSYACNLPVELQRAKLLQLTEAIDRRFRTPARIYRAGRYGIGPASPAHLIEAGIRIDTSVRSLFDYRAGHGPDFTASPLAPYWLEPGTLAELPVTSVFAGTVRGWGRGLFRRMGPRATAVAARTGLLERIALTPEGIPADRARHAVRLAVADGLPLLVFSFHSPSLVPGHTPYVRSQEDLERFYGWWQGVFATLAELGVAPASLDVVLAAAGLSDDACQRAKA